MAKARREVRPAGKVPKWAPPPAYGPGSSPSFVMAGGRVYRIKGGGSLQQIDWLPYPAALPHQDTPK